MGNNPAKPTLSVIMSNYNHGRYLDESLSSIVQQSFKPTELIVIDDASTDNSVEIIERYARQYPFIRLLKNEKNRGVSDNSKRLVRMVAGRYLCSISADDAIRPGYFEKGIELLSRYPEAGLCCAESIIVEEQNSVKRRFYLSKEARYFSKQEAAQLFAKNPASPPFRCYMPIIRTVCLQEAGGYLDDLKWSIDTFADTVISCRHGFCYIPEALSMARRAEGQYGSSMVKNMPLEWQVIRNMIAHLRQKEYADILPVFKRNAAGMSHYPWEVFRVVIRHREYYDLLSYKLVNSALYDKLVKRTLLKIFPYKVLVKTNNLVKRIKSLFSGGKVIGD